MNELDALLTKLLDRYIGRPTLLLLVRRLYAAGDERLLRLMEDHTTELGNKDIEERDKARGGLVYARTLDECLEDLSRSLLGCQKQVDQDEEQACAPRRVYERLCQRKDGEQEFWADLEAHCPQEAERLRPLIEAARYDREFDYLTSEQQALILPYREVFRGWATLRRAYSELRRRADDRAAWQRLSADPCRRADAERLCSLADVVWGAEVEYARLPPELRQLIIPLREECRRETNN